MEYLLFKQRYVLLALILTLLQAKTWLEIAKKLMPDGRIMVNCGGADTAVSLAADTGVSSWVQNPTIKALCSAFPGQVRRYLPDCQNYMTAGA